MNLSEQILKKNEAAEKVDENVSTNCHLNMKVGEHEIGMNVSVNVYKCYMHNGQPQKDDDVEMQTKLQAMFKSDIDTLLKNVAEKLKALKNL